MRVGDNGDGNLMKETQSSIEAQPVGCVMVNPQTEKHSDQSAPPPKHPPSQAGELRTGRSQRGGVSGEREAATNAAHGHACTRGFVWYAVPGHAVPGVCGSWDMRFLASSKLDPMTRAASTLTNECPTCPACRARLPPLADLRAPELHLTRQQASLRVHLDFDSRKARHTSNASSKYRLKLMTGQLTKRV